MSPPRFTPEFKDEAVQQATKLLAAKSEILRLRSHGRR